MNKLRLCQWLKLGPLAALVLIASCSGIPDGLQVVTGFEPNRYLGKWFEIARLDHRFERGLTAVTAEYSWRDDGGITVRNRGYDAGSGQWEEAVGRAYLTGAADVGQLKVSFFGPFYASYNIIELDQDSYAHALVTGPSRDYLWILARTPTLKPAHLEQLVARADSLGFDTAALIFVEHPPPPIDDR